MSKHSFIYIRFDLKSLFCIQICCFSLDTEPERQQDIVQFSTRKQHNSTSRRALIFKPHRKSVTADVWRDVRFICTGLHVYNSCGILPCHSGDAAELLAVRCSRLSAALCCVLMCEIEEREIAEEATMAVLSAKTWSECSKVHWKCTLR